MINLPEWFIEKNFTENEKYVISTTEESPIVQKETEKAKLLCWATKFGMVRKWVPKSIINGTCNYKNIDGKYEKALRKDGQTILIKFHGKDICEAVGGKIYATKFLTFID